MDTGKENNEESDSKKLSSSMRKKKNKNGTQNSESTTRLNLLPRIASWKKNSSRNSQKKTAKSKSEATNNTSSELAVSKTQADAGVFNPPKPASDAEENDNIEVKTVPAVTEPHAEEYLMTHKRRGKAIILNHQNFDREDPRAGSEKDVERLKHVLPELKFEVDVYQDLDYFDIIKLFKKLSKEDFNDCDCIAFFILTHGNRKKEISAKDVYYPLEKLWELFTADNCLTLAGKPKLFFINACRGKKKDSGIRFHWGRTEADSSGRQETYKIPKHADFLIAYSTVDGYLSYRETANGTWFIQSLCEVLLEHHKEKDLLKMLTITSRKVAVDYRTHSEKNEDCELTQVPSLTSMLIRDVYFRI